MNNEKFMNKIIELLREFETSDNITDYYKHDFDTIVDLFTPIIGLHGLSYQYALKMHIYSILANTLKLNTFSFNFKKLDMRINLLVFIEAGHGKNELKRFIRRTTQGLGKQYQSPTSYHPEQFVGKIIVHDTKKDTSYTPVFGSLASDTLVIDEAYELLNGKDAIYKESLKYMRLALDPIGDNTIEKKQVNVPDEEKLQYNPICTIDFYTQPLALVNEELLTRGTLRRFMCVFINTPKEERIEALRASKLTTPDQINSTEVLFRVWLRLNKSLSERKNLTFSINDDDANLIDKYINKLDSDIPAASKFIKTIIFNIKYNIYRMAMVRAIVESNDNNIVISKNDIERAIKDFDGIWQPLIEYVCQNMQTIDDIKFTDDEKLLFLALKDGELKQSEVLQIFIKRHNLDHHGKDYIMHVENLKGSFKNKISKAVTSLRNKMYLDYRILEKNAHMLFLTESGKRISNLISNQETFSNKRIFTK